MKTSVINLFNLVAVLSGPPTGVQPLRKLLVDHPLHEAVKKYLEDKGTPSSFVTTYHLTLGIMQHDQLHQEVLMKRLVEESYRTELELFSSHPHASPYIQEFEEDAQQCNDIDQANTAMVGHNLKEEVKNPELTVIEYMHAVRDMKLRRRKTTVRRHMNFHLAYPKPS